MSCRELITLFLDEWLEGRLPPRRRAQVLAHLHRCAACRDYAGSYRALLDALHRAEPAPPLDEALVQSILRAQS